MALVWTHGLAGHISVYLSVLRLCHRENQEHVRRVTFDTETIRTRLREVAFLNSAATIRFDTSGARGSNGSNGSNGSSGSEEGTAVETFHFSGGISEFVKYNNRSRSAMHEPIFVSHMVSRLLWS